ncbi:MAG: hypothetical protein RIB30_10505 [Thalassospira sp.]|uniref:hypothetical protein n=1 Tax=Thalassospira sp. TaxID=1912094 RepID=UPI0032ED11FA
MKIEDKFQGLWCRALRLPSLEVLTPELIEQWAREKNLENPVAVTKNVGRFEPRKSIVLTVGGRNACFPMVPTVGNGGWSFRRKAREEQADLWQKVEWFAPLWIPIGKANELLESIKNVSKDRALEIFNYHTSTLYTLPFEAVCIEQVMTEAPSLKKIVPLAREAYLGAYSGSWATSIASLIPAIEGSLTRITADLDCKVSSGEKNDHAISRAMRVAAELHFDNMWTPEEYLTCDYLFGEDENVFVLETYRRWLKNCFFCKTEAYAGKTWLNRHMFAHGTEASWQQRGNFTRLIVALATLAMIEVWYDRTHRLGAWLPSMNAESKLLWQQALFRAENQMKLKVLEQKLYHDHGRLVPELPNDDGVLLRGATLTTECMDDLVRPLRNAGWNVNVNEPDDDALYMTVEAFSGEKCFCVALLYSCATSNEIYRELEKKCAVILYRGAPYHQDSYAHGIGAYVGPILGWQPPKLEVCSS